MKQQRKEEQPQGQIKVLQRKTYGCLAKVFCCKCVHCCQDFDFSLLTSNNRKELFQTMIKRYIGKLHKHEDRSVIMDPFFIMVALLLGEESETYNELMGFISNQGEPTVFSKQDLQFYIPELCTYLVFHEELRNIELEKLLVRACKVDIHFSLKYYFYMHSLEVIKSQDQLTCYEGVTTYNSHFRTMINHYYQGHKHDREAVTLLQSKGRLQESVKIERRMSEGEGSVQTDNGEDKENIRSTFGGLHQSSIVVKSKEDLLQREDNYRNMNQLSEDTDNKDQPKIPYRETLKISKLKFLQQSNVYEPFIAKPAKFPRGLFESTVNFFADLIELGGILVQSTSRKEEAKEYVSKINKRLPATVYIPFTSNFYQDLNVISVVTGETRVFSTKDRAPYYVCFESFYNPTYNEGISRDKKIRSDSRLRKEQLRKPNLFEDEKVEKVERKDDWLRESQISIKMEKIASQEEKDIRSSGKGIKKFLLKKSWSNFFNLDKIKKKILKKKDEQNEEEEYHEEEWSQKKSQSTTEQINIQLAKSNSLDDQGIEDLFGESSVSQFQRISHVSPYSDLPGYRLIHVIIKSNDDLRQECFAMQLLQEFDKIFQMENLAVKLSPYEVLPLSHDAGIIEFVRDAITIDQLLKKKASLSSVLNNQSKRKNFLSSLVGYSLVTYFLQVKDRHNGNIMIKRDGSLLHIDYGFFMTNMPGKGVQLEKNLPFKLTNEYVDALEGLDSKTFQDFRLLFYKAFNACRKHQHRIVILTKLMYSSYGRTMACFTKGDESVERLEERFNPKGVSNDAEVSVFCQGLINSSIDNWRSRWYDKWQYYMQGIFY